MKTIAVIMAGGRGERFWPLSRKKMPKQFLALEAGGKSMLRRTAERALSLAPYEDVFVVTCEDYAGLVKADLPMLPEANVLAEPQPKGTAPCVALAAAAAGSRYGDAVMLVLPSDHLIRGDERFAGALQKAARTAQAGENLVTVGIWPTRPETGYGYIRFEPDETPFKGVYAVSRFVEKPDAKTAEAFLESGRYLWNGGIFVFTVSTITKAFGRFLPQVAEGLAAIRAAWDTPEAGRVLAERYAGFPAVSLDTGIMERAANIFTVVADFEWDDAGSWRALEKLYEADDDGNIVTGDAVTVNARDCAVVGGDRLVAAVGVSGLIIVDAGDAVLICDKAHAQDVRQVLKRLRDRGRNELL